MQTLIYASVGWYWRNERIFWMMVIGTIVSLVLIYLTELLLPVVTSYIPLNVFIICSYVGYVGMYTSLALIQGPIKRTSKLFIGLAFTANAINMISFFGRPHWGALVYGAYSMVFEVGNGTAGEEAPDVAKQRNPNQLKPSVTFTLIILGGLVATVAMFFWPYHVSLSPVWATIAIYAAIISAFGSIIASLMLNGRRWQAWDGWYRAILFGGRFLFLWAAIPQPNEGSIWFNVAMLFTFGMTMLLEQLGKYFVPSLLAYAQD